MKAMGLAGLLIVLCGCRQPGGVRAGDLEVREAFLYAPVTLESAAAYLTVINHGAAPDSLVGLTTPLAQDVMLHGRMTDGDAENLEFPLAVLPGYDLVFEPGGRHLMLMDLTRQPAPGDTIELTLRFAGAGPVTVRVPVRDYVE